MMNLDNHQDISIHVHVIEKIKTTVLKICLPQQIYKLNKALSIKLSISIIYILIMVPS